MNAIDVIQSVSAGICFYAGIHHFIVGLRRRPMDRVQLLFGLMSLLYGVYSLNIFLLYAALDSGSLARYVAVDRWGIATAYLAFGLFYWFVAAYTRAGSRLLVGAIVAFWVVVAVSNFVLPLPVVYTDIELTSTFPPNIVIAPWYPFLSLTAWLCLFVYPPYAIIKQYRRWDQLALAPPLMPRPLLILLPLGLLYGVTKAYAVIEARMVWIILVTISVQLLASGLRGLSPTLAG